MANKILTPITLWSGFDDSLPLHAETKREYTAGKTVYSEIAFSGRAVGGERVRICALYAHPAEGGSYPALLILPDAGRTYEEALVRLFAEKGYAVLMPDYRGAWEGVKNYTVYPQAVAYGNYKDAGRHLFYADETAKETSWYEWVAVARYALRLLRMYCPESPIGAIGLKAGGDIVWQLAATSDELSCAIPVCAGGWAAYKGIQKFGENFELKMDEERYRFLGGVDSQAYAPYVRCPVLMLCSTNDDRFDADRAFDTFARVNAEQEKTFYFSARYNGHIGNTAIKDLELFAAKYLKGREVFIPSPVDISIEEEDGELVAKICFDKNGEADYCEVFMAEDMPDSCLRDWTRCQLKRTDGDDTAYFYLNAYQGAKTVFAFAKAKYSCGFAVSSKIAVKRIEKQFTNMVPKNRVLFSSKNGTDSFTLDKYDDNVLADCFLENSVKPVRLIEGPCGIKGVYSSYGLRLYRINDEMYRPAEHAIIKFDAYAQAAAVIEVNIYVAKGDDRECFSSTVNLTGAEEWMPCILSAKDFKNEVGKPIGSIAEGAYITFHSKNLFCINNLLWL